MRDEHETVWDSGDIAIFALTEFFTERAVFAEFDEREHARLVGLMAAIPNPHE